MWFASFGQSKKTKKQLSLVDKECEFVLPIKRYLDHLTSLERSPHTLENDCRHLCLYFPFLEQLSRDWQHGTSDDLVSFVQWLRDPQRQAGVLSIHRTSLLSERSVNTIVTAVRSFARSHIQRGETLQNPCSTSKFPIVSVALNRSLCIPVAEKPGSGLSNLKSHRSASRL